MMKINIIYSNALANKQCSSFDRNWLNHRKGSSLLRQFIKVTISCNFFVHAQICFLIQPTIQTEKVNSKVQILPDNDYFLVRTTKYFSRTKYPTKTPQGQRFIRGRSFMTSAFLGPFWPPPSPPRQQMSDFRGPPPSPLSAHVRFLRPPPCNVIFQLVRKSNFWSTDWTK